MNVHELAKQVLRAWKTRPAKYGPDGRRTAAYKAWGKEFSGLIAGIAGVRNVHAHLRGDADLLAYVASERAYQASLCG